MTRFEDATAVRRVAEGRYLAELDGGFGFAEALNGGYLMAVLLRAAVDTSPHHHPVATSASFLRVAKPGPAEVLVEQRRTGRTTTSARVCLTQGDEPILDMQVSTATLDSSAEPMWAGERARSLPPLPDCLTFDSGKEDRGFADQVDMRFDPAVMGWLDGRPSGRLEGGAHFRLRDDMDPDAYVLALAVDALPPVVLNAGGYGWSPTVELTWYMRAVPAPGWLAVHGGGRLLSDGWFDEEVEVWDSAGKLVAQSRQIARVGRPRN
jgi:acyl-CoA thioesterase